MMPALWMTALRAGWSAASFGRRLADVGGVFDVEGDGGHAGIGGGGLVEDLLAAAGDDDFVAELVEGFCEAAADAGAAAGDEDGVSGGFHLVRSSPELDIGCW